MGNNGNAWLGNYGGAHNSRCRATFRRLRCVECARQRQSYVQGPYPAIWCARTLSTAVSLVLLEAEQFRVATLNLS